MDENGEIKILLKTEDDNNGSNKNDAGFSNI